MKSWAKALYQSKSWEEIRDAYMLGQQWICERCGAPAKICHHKTWLTPANIDSPYISLSQDNLEALCQDCHNKEHYRQSRDSRYQFDAQGNILKNERKGRRRGCERMVSCASPPLKCFLEGGQKPRGVL